MPLSEYEEVVQEPFYGSLFYQAHQSSKLTPDLVYAYVPPGDVHLNIHQGSGDRLENRGYEQTLGRDERLKRTEADTQRAVEELDQIIGYLTDGSGAESAVFDNKMIEKLKNVKNILSILEEE